LSAGAALLVLNRSAGMGHAEAFSARLVEALGAGYGDELEVETAVVDDHASARTAAARFATSAARPSLVVGAGGGGTLRAVVEGVMDVFVESPPDPATLCFAGLRMGSGNVIARSLGIPLDPVEGARLIGAGFAQRRVAKCAVMRCRHGTSDGGTTVRHAVTMCGLGAWGRVPGDIARWRQSHPAGRRRAASWIGLERVNTLEYVAFGTRRMLAAAMSASRCELVEVDGRPTRLLAAVALNLPLGDEAVGLTVVPRFGRPIRRRLEPGRGLTLRLLDRESVEFFLDEDPELAFDWLTLEVAGCLSFVPGVHA
jgi:diacylglycerol kinase-like protein